MRHPTLSRILLGGLLAALASVVAIALLRSFALSALDVDPGFSPLQSLSSIVFTLIAAVGATLVFAALARTSERPIDRFLRISTIVLLLSLIPDLVLLIWRGPFPGTSLATVGVLTLMHFVAAAIIVGVTLWVATGESPLHLTERAAHRG